jgi:superfamily II DNA or RNA helicase/HKD family nuclease/diadenosine tetraphosphate (Ap4A) HIT family hydrolase
MNGSRKCPFCNPDASQVFYEGRHVIALWDSLPVSPGHALLVSRRHVANWFDTTSEERSELLAAIDIVRDTIISHYKPDGFNMGIDIGEAAGQAIFHVHLHVIPRYREESQGSMGGLRHVMPEKGEYRRQVNIGETSLDAKIGLPWMIHQISSLPHAEPLVCGGEDPLLPHILANLDCAERTDMAIAFVLESGVELIEEHLRDLLDRGAHIRLLTGDYLGITDPRALYRLLDLQEGAKGTLDLKIFESGGISFHPKAYIFYFEEPTSSGIAYVGSSNLSAQALGGGIEWNYRIIRAEMHKGFQAVVDAFERLFKHPKSRRIDTSWIHEYHSRRKPLLAQTHTAIISEETQQSWKKSSPREKPAEFVSEEIHPPPEPHEIQVKALDALQRTRAEGNRSGLVVLATGLGKTWLAAFDSVRFHADRVLFVAHREEILRQALKTFRRIRPEENLGIYSGREKSTDSTVLFASIQTLGRIEHLHRFSPNSFDYIIVDEFHHASARSYRKLIDYFQPQFLLGLTATPERTDGGDLLALCSENLVFRCDLLDGIRMGLLCPFNYYGVPDDVDYRNIPWRSGHFDEDALTRAVATQKRAQNALEQYRTRAGQRTLAFCCSQLHADFMAAFFFDRGIRAAAVHSGAHSAPRASTLKQLTKGELEIVFVVDMFNEGIDLPNIDTVLMLRPTESRILWTQQFGRGLRVAPGKDYLRVIDYIGNHRTFRELSASLRRRIFLGTGGRQTERGVRGCGRA